MSPTDPALCGTKEVSREAHDVASGSVGGSFVSSLTLFRRHHYQVINSTSIIAMIPQMFHMIQQVPQILLWMAL